MGAQWSHVASALGRGGRISRVGDFRIHMEPQCRPPDLVTAELAALQHGVISHGQLLALGLGLGPIKYRMRVGRLHVIHRGVYAVGHSRLTVRGRWMAAVLAFGEGALLSHRSAAAL